MDETNEYRCVCVRVRVLATLLHHGLLNHKGVIVGAGDANHMNLTNAPQYTYTLTPLTSTV